MPKGETHRGVLTLRDRKIFAREPLDMSGHIEVDGMTKEQMLEKGISEEDAEEVLDGNETAPEGAKAQYHRRVEDVREEKLSYFHHNVARIRKRIENTGKDLEYLDMYEGRSGLTLGDELRAEVLGETKGEDIRRILEHSDVDLMPLLHAAFANMDEGQFRAVMAGGGQAEANDGE